MVLVNRTNQHLMRYLLLLINIWGTMSLFAQSPSELLGRPTAQSITINAFSSADMELFWEWGTKQGEYPNKTLVYKLNADTPIDVEIEKLNADTKYYYRCRFRPWVQARNMQWGWSIIFKHKEKQAHHFDL